MPLENCICESLNKNQVRDINVIIIGQIIECNRPIELSANLDVEVRAGGSVVRAGGRRGVS